MGKWLRDKLQQLHLLNPKLPARIVIPQVVKDSWEKVPDLQNECATVMAERLIFGRRIRQTMSTENLTLEEFFHETNERAGMWKVLFIQEKVILLVRNHYIIQMNGLRGKYGDLLPRTYHDRDTDRALLQRFQEELRSTIFSIEPNLGKLMSNLGRAVHEAIKKNNPAQLNSTLTRLQMPEESIQEVADLLSACALDLFKVETARQERQEAEKAKLKQREQDQTEAAILRDFNVAPQTSNTQDGLSLNAMPESGTTKPESVRDKVFVSYSHSDAQWLKMLKTHLRPFERQGLIKRWDDTEIKSGQIWKDEIKKAIQSAKVVVLLVSPDFLASDFIATDELPPLLKGAETEGATILSVIIKPCSYMQTEGIAKYQAINPPNRTLAKMKVADRHEVFSLLTTRILEILSNH